MSRNADPETTVTYNPIGVIHTPFLKREGMPIQPRGAEGVRGVVEVFEPYRPGLQDLDGFSHAILLYHFHMSEGYNLQVTPFMDTTPHGVFATRAPKRPNPIGISVVRIVGLCEEGLAVENVDMLDATPLLDIKPYVPAFDPQGDIRTGWLEDASRQVREKRSDDRFR